MRNTHERLYSGLIVRETFTINGFEAVGLSEYAQNTLIRRAVDGNQ